MCKTAILLNQKSSCHWNSLQYVYMQEISLTFFS